MSDKNPSDKICESSLVSCVRDKDFIHSPHTNTTTLCPPLPSSSPLCSFLLAFVAPTSPPPPFSLLPCLSLFCPASHSLLMWTKWKGNRLVQGCDLALLTPTHSTVLRGSQQRENHTWARMQTSFTPSEIWRGGGKRIPAALLVAAANATQTSGGGSEWHNWVSGGVISSAIVTNVTLTSWPRDCCDYGAQSRHAHSSLEAGGIQWSKNTSPSAGKRHRCSKRQQTLQ